MACGNPPNGTPIPPATRLRDTAGKPVPRDARTIWGGRYFPSERRETLTPGPADSLVAWVIRPPAATTS